MSELAPGEPLLSICIPNYNRAAWLAASLRAFAPQVRDLEDVVELCVADNCSEEDVPGVIDEIRRLCPIKFHRHASNLGPFPNFFHLVDKMATGRYVWMLGNDDIVRPGAVARVVEAIRAHSEARLFYVNYKTWIPSRPGEVITDAASVSIEKPLGSKRDDDHAVTHVQDLIAYDTNVFTPAFSCILTREDSVAAYKDSIHAKAWESLESTLPAPVYIAGHLLDAPAWHLGEPCIIANVESTWMSHLALFSLKILPEMLDRFEACGAKRATVDVMRRYHVAHSASYMRNYLQNSKAPQNASVSLRRYLWKHKRFPQLWWAVLLLVPLLIVPRSWYGPIKGIARGSLRLLRRERANAV